MTNPADNAHSPHQPVQGEGDYEAAAAYEKSVKTFVETKRDDVAELAREAAEALDGPEGDALRAAEETGKAHSKGENSL